MKVRESLFDSRAEDDLFQRLRGSWEPEYQVFPHVPFSSLIDIAPTDLSPGELSFLHKTTVDYVLATPEGRPLLAVEFDGLGHGFSQEGTYIQQVPVRRDPSRQWKLTLKARVADSVRFPFMIVSYDEKAALDEATGLTFVHGIIGEFVAHHHFRHDPEPLFDEDEAEWLATLPRNEQYEVTQDRITSKEVAADLRWNPVARLEAELMGRLFGLGQGATLSYRHLEDGVRPSTCDLFGDDFDARELRKWMESRPRLGCEATVTAAGRSTSRSVWMRRISTLGVDPICLVVQAACVLAMRAALSEDRGVAAP